MKSQKRIIILLGRAGVQLSFFILAQYLLQGFMSICTLSVCLSVSSVSLSVTHTLEAFFLSYHKKYGFSITAFSHIHLTTVCFHLSVSQDALRDASQPLLVNSLLSLISACLSHVLYTCTPRPAPFKIFSSPLMFSIAKLSMM